MANRHCLTQTKLWIFRKDPWGAWGVFKHVLLTSQPSPCQPENLYLTSPIF